jgi:hypothetical protein
MAVVVSDPACSIRSSASIARQGSRQARARARCACTMIPVT